MGPFELDSITKLSRVSGNHPWIETILITGLFFLIGTIVEPTDPLLTERIFPWSIFAPMLTGLRYGFAHGFVTAVSLHAAAGIYAWLVGEAIWPLPFSYSLGLLLCSLIVGEFRDIWEQRLDRLERSNQYRQARMEEFTRSYHVLKISHDELEQEYAGRRTSLRSALLTAREKLMDSPADKIGGELLDLLATFISVRSASYHMVVDDLLHPLPSATLGTTTTLRETDPLLLKAIETKATVSVSPEDTASLAGRDQSDPIVVIPVVDAYKRVRAVVGITQIPFFALTERNLQIATIMASRFGDFLHATERLPTRLDDDLYWFLYQSMRCLDLANQHDLQSALVVCQLNDSTTAPLYIKTILAQARGLDEAFPWQENGRWYLLLLMPLTTEQGLGRFLVRFDDYLTESHGVGLTKADIDVSHHIFKDDHQVSDLTGFLASALGSDCSILESLKALSEPSDKEVEHQIRISA